MRDWHPDANISSDVEDAIDEIAEIDCAPKQRPLPPFDPVEPGMTWNGVPQHEAGPSVDDTFVRHAPELSCIC